MFHKWGCLYCMCATWGHPRRPRGGHGAEGKLGWVDNCLPFLPAPSANISPLTQFPVHPAICPWDSKDCLGGGEGGELNFEFDIPLDITKIKFIWTSHSTKVGLPKNINGPDFHSGNIPQCTGKQQSMAHALFLVHDHRAQATHLLEAPHGSRNS